MFCRLSLMGLLLALVACHPSQYLYPLPNASTPDENAAGTFASFRMVEKDGKAMITRINEDVSQSGVKNFSAAAVGVNYLLLTFMDVDKEVIRTEKMAHPIYPSAVTASEIASRKDQEAKFIVWLPTDPSAVWMIVDEFIDDDRVHTTEIKL